MKISKRFSDRAKASLRDYQKILNDARSRDVNESDTVVIVADFMRDVLGYDKYQEITTEFAIRSTFCDLAVKVDGRVHFLIEVKAVGTDLKDNHIRQAVDYGANQGLDWVVLTNGIRWQAYRLRFEKPIEHEMVLDIDLLDPAKRASDYLEPLFLLSREASGAGAIEEYRKRQESMNRFVVGQLILSEDSVRLIRRELRRLSPGLKVEDEEIVEILQTEVLKRDVIEDERAKTAATAVKRAAKRQLRKSRTDEHPIQPADGQ